MMHTFLFDPGVWSSRGTFWREDGEPLDAQGRTVIAHHAECWLLSGTLQVLGSPPVEFVSAYTIQPTGRDGYTLKWTSENSTLGKLSGTFAVVGNNILSVYTCGTSGYHGSEHLTQNDATHYQSAGILLLNERRLYSWQLTLTRSASEPHFGR